FVGELLFGDEGVFLQPLQELLAVCGHHLRLRVMRVRIDETGANNAVRIVRDWRVGSCRLSHLIEGTGCDDASVLDEHAATAVVVQTIVGRMQKRIVAKTDDAAAQQRLCCVHCRPPVQPRCQDKSVDRLRPVRYSRGSSDSTSQILSSSVSRSAQRRVAWPTLRPGLNALP